MRVRATFDNADGKLIPGQFARLQMGQPKTAPALAISERAIGTDQSKRYVMVVGGDNKAEYREVALGPVLTDGLRVVTSGLKAGERIVVNGLQRVRPGALVAPQVVSMNVQQAQRFEELSTEPRSAERRCAASKGDMNFSSFFIDRPIFAGVISMLIFVAGLLALRVMPISEYPEVVPPSVIVRANIRAPIRR